MKKFLALALCALLIVPMVFAVSAADDLKDVTLRWDFDDLNEKNGLITLLPNEQSEANEDLVEFKDGVMNILGHGTDYDFSTPIVLDDAHDWSVEFRVALADYSILLGGDTKGSLIYLAAGVGQWSNPIRIIPDGVESPNFVDDTNKGITFGDYLEDAYEMNTWRITYTAKDMAVIIEILKDGKWEEVGSAYTDEEYTITFTRLFGRYATNPFANFCGEIDYLEIKARAAVAAATEDTTPVVEDTTVAVEDTTVAVEDTTVAVEDTTVAVEDTTVAVEDTTVAVEEPDAPATADIAIVFAAVAAIATSGAIILKKKH